MSQKPKSNFHRVLDEMRIYLTPRFLLGIGLIISSLFAVLLIRSSSDRWVNVLSATRPLAPGSLIREGDFTEVSIRARDGLDKYLASSAPIIGSTVVRQIGDGEFIPSRALTTDRDPTLRHVALSFAATEVPFQTRPGENVDLYAIPRESPSQQSAAMSLSQSELILAGIGIDGMDTKSRDFGGNTSITFLIPDRYVARVLSASISSKLVIVRR